MFLTPRTTLAIPDPSHSQHGSDTVRSSPFFIAGGRNRRYGGAAALRVIREPRGCGVSFDGSVG